MAPSKAIVTVKKSTDSPSITPDRERRVTKQPYHGLSVISLQFHHKANNTIPRDSLALVLRKDLQTALKENKSRVMHSHGHKLVTYNIKDEKCVVEFLAEWVRDMDAAESLRVSLESDLGEKEYTVPETLANFNTIIKHFSNMDLYNSNLYDSMIDWFITWLRNDEEINFNMVFKICEYHDKMEDGGLVRVCANVLVHHGQELLTPRTFSLCELWLQEHIKEAVKDKIPGDVMDDNFPNHCAYHLHGDDAVCYKNKINEKISKLDKLI